MNLRTRSLQLLIGVTVMTWTIGCAAQTRYAGLPVSDLTDEQLVEELASAAEGLGMAMDRTMYLLAIRPEPAYVLTSSTTTFAGTVNATYSGYSMPVGYGTHMHGRGTGTVSGVAATQYQYTDVNAGARLGNAIAVAITQSRQRAFRRRGLEVLEEYESRVELRRRETEQLIRQFFVDYPHLQDRRMLVAVVAPWAAAEGLADGRDILERTREIVDDLDRREGISGSWYGMFAQTTTLDDGEVFAFSEFVRVELEETPEGRIGGNGMLGTGEVLEFDGQRQGSRISATVANVTSGINVEFEAIPSESQMTGEFSGFGAGQRMSGTVLLLR